MYDFSPISRIKKRRHGWIRTIVEGFADLSLSTRPRDYIS